VDDRPSPVSPSGAAPTRVVRRPAPGQGLLSAILTVGAVLVIGGISLLQGAEPTPSPDLSPDPSSVALTSPEASSSGDPSPDPSAGAPTFDPSAAAPSADSSPAPSPAEATVTPPPASPPPIQGRLWHREPIGEMARFDLPFGPWVVGDTFVILGGSGTPGYSADVRYVLRSADGLSWEKDPIGITTDEIVSSTIADGRIWLMARARIGNEPSSWQLVSTGDGIAWEGSDPVDLPFRVDADNRGELVRTSGRWLTTLGNVIWESTDGSHWTKATEQLVGSEQAFLHLARRDATTAVAIGAVWQADDMGVKAMVRRDGEDSWSTREFSMPPYSIIERVGCRADGCVAVGALSGAYEQPMAWRSTDGLRWSGVELDVPAGPYASQVGPLVVSDAGFLVHAIMTGHAWLSTNGSTWRLIRTQPVDLNDPAVFLEYVWSAAAKGDVVLALGALQDGPKQGYMGGWVGRFSEMLP
jgi:hypothetical protein